MVTIVLADDQNIVRQGTRLVLEQCKNFYIVGETDNGIDALHLIERLKPQLLISELILPQLSGLAVAQQIAQLNLSTHMIILSSNIQEQNIIQALVSGVSSYVSKTATVADLIQAIVTVYAGGQYLSPSLLNYKSLEDWIQQAQKMAPLFHGRLTSREQQVLQLVGEGCTSSQIGKRLSISARTVEVHRANIMRKLNLRSYAALIRYAIGTTIANPENNDQIIN